MLFLTCVHRLICSSRLICAPDDVWLLRGVHSVVLPPVVNMCFPLSLYVCLRLFFRVSPNVYDWCYLERGVNDVNLVFGWYHG